MASKQSPIAKSLFAPSRARLPPEKSRRSRGGVKRTLHRGRSDAAANANANSDAPRKVASEF